MTTLRFDDLVTETSQRLYGLNALIELIDQATPGFELEERNALEQMAKLEDWEYGDYDVENQFLNIKFDWLPRMAAYSIFILLSSIVETQLLAFARRIGRGKSPFDPNDLKGSVLDRVRVYVKKVSDLDLSQNKHWQHLKDLQDLRDIIVHRAGKPRWDDMKERQHVERMRKSYPGVSVDKNRHTLKADVELNFSVHSCRYFAAVVEDFFKNLFKDAGMPTRIGLWPNIQSGFVRCLATQRRKP
jgi:hypothetical protein